MEPSLSAELLADRDDPRRWAVYADWLEAQGNPHGALVSLMLQREARPTRALAKAMKEREQLLSELTPGALRMFVARERPHLAPVFRRGFLWSAGAADDADFTELVGHPACAFVDRALLEPSTSAQLTAWLEQGGVLPWRTVHVAVPEGVVALDLSPLISRLPWLTSLQVACANEVNAFTLGDAPSLRDVTLVGGSVALLEEVLRAPALTRLKLGLSSRERYEPEGADRLELMARRLTAAMPRLETVILEGLPGEAAEALVDGPLGARLVVRSTEPEETRPAFDPWPAGDETCFVVVRGKLTDTHRQTLTQFAKHAGARRVVATVAEARLGSTTLSLLRLHGEGEMPLVPRAIANQLARSDPALDVAAISLSSSNTTAAAWTVGPHAASEGASRVRRASAPALRFEASFFSREPLVREALDGLLGFDPGLDVLGVLLDQLDVGTRETWLGEALRSHERLPLFTDLDARRDEEIDEDEERELEGRTDALDDPDEDDDWGGYADEDAEAPNEWGGEPVIVLEPAPEQPDDVRVLPGAHLEDDDPEDDLDPPGPDAYEAREGDVWNDGPVELPDHHDATIGDPISEPDGELPRVHFDETMQPCDRCHDVKTLRRCQRCGADVCRSCVTGWSLDLLDDDGREFVCVDCVDHPMAQRHVPPERTRRG